MEVLPGYARQAFWTCISHHWRNLARQTGISAADIFSIINELNLSLHGRDSNILRSHDKVAAFNKKLGLWKTRINTSLGMFPTLSDYINNDPSINADLIVCDIGKHLDALIQHFDEYFTNDNIDYSVYNWWCWFALQIAMCPAIWVFCSKFYCNKCGGPPTMPEENRGLYSKKFENRCSRLPLLCTSREDNILYIQ